MRRLPLPDASCIQISGDDLLHAELSGFITSTPWSDTAYWFDWSLEFPALPFVPTTSATVGLVQVVSGAAVTPVSHSSVSMKRLFGKKLRYTLFKMLWELLPWPAVPTLSFPKRTFCGKSPSPFNVSIIVPRRALDTCPSLNGTDADTTSGTMNKCESCYCLQPEKTSQTIKHEGGAQRTHKDASSQGTERKQYASVWFQTLNDFQALCWNDETTFFRPAMWRLLWAFLFRVNATLAGVTGWVLISIEPRWIPKHFISAQKITFLIHRDGGLRFMVRLIQKAAAGTLNGGQYSYQPGLTPLDP